MALSGAQLMNGASYAPGIIAQAFHLDGVGGYVALPDNVLPYAPFADTNAPFSFETWFLTSTGGVILGQQAGKPFDVPTNGWLPVVYVGTDGVLRCEAFWSGSPTNQLHTPMTVNDGAFHHCAVTFDGGVERLYLDGQLAQAKPFQQIAYWTN